MHFSSFASSNLRLDRFDGLIPFDFKTEPTDSNSKYLGERWRGGGCGHCLLSAQEMFFPRLSCLCYLLLLCRSFSVNLVSLELTYFCSGLLFAAVVQRRVWDYALTVTLVHVAITSLGEQKPGPALRRSAECPGGRLCFSLAVMLEFPLVWQWWLALGIKECTASGLIGSVLSALDVLVCVCAGSGLFLMICNGQLIAYFTCQSEQTFTSFSLH